MVPRALEIETPRLRLRPFRESDLDDLARINSDAEASRWLNNGKPFTRDDSWRHIAIYTGHLQMRGYTMLAIEDRKTGQLLGRCGPWFPEGWPMLEVGWLVDPNRRREGIATEAALGALDRAFENLEVTEICSLIRRDNLPSAGVAKKLGARFDRVLEDFFGGPTDIWIHTRPE